MNKGWRIVAAIFAATLLAGCHHGPTEQEQFVMAQLESSLVPQCVGRYVADLPKGFAWRRPNVTLYYGKDIDFTKIDVAVVDQHTTQDAFDLAVAARKAKLESITNLKTHKPNLIAATKRVRSILFTSYDDFGDTTAREHELHKLVGDAHVVIKAKSYEGVTDEPKALSPAVEAHMLELAKHIHPVTDPDKAGPGFCLGSVVVDSNNDFESAQMDFTMAKHPDLHFHVWMTNQDNPSKTLRERVSRINALADGKRLTILKSGDTTLAGMPAQVDMSKIVEDRTEYQFVIEARPEQPSFSQEGMQISLDTGVQLADGRYLSSTLTQDEAEALWSAVIKSFRPRSGAVRVPGNGDR